jgi:FkbM family methyltransferase
MKTHSLRYRAQLLKAKSRGYFRETGWGRLLSLFPKPTTSWPVGAMVEPRRGEQGLMEFDSPMGLFWAPEGDREVLANTEIEILSGVYSYGGAIIEPGDVIFDLGANLGTFTRWALDCGAARVISFEPQALYRECLRRTFAKEIADRRVSLISAPVWSRKKRLQFTGVSLVAHVAELPGIESGSGDSVAMDSVTLDEVTETQGLLKVDFIKADIEGAERHALMGASDLIRKYRPRIAFCVYHYPDDPEVIAGLLHSYQDYRIVFDSSGRYIYCW